VVREHHSLDLGQLTENRIALGEDISRRILHQLVSLLCFLRQWKVGHFDLQPKNLLVQKKGWIIKVAGWSNYRQFTKKFRYNDAYNHNENKSCYMAPELLERREYGLAADSWSVGAVLCNLITGYLPFADRRHASSAYNALKENNSEVFWSVNSERTKGLMASTKSIIFNLLKFNAKDRLDIEDVKKEKYFQGRIQSDSEFSSGMKENFDQLKWRLD
jgi:serine/threonine protein kinase